MNDRSKRSQERVSRRLKVFYGLDKPQHLGFVKNLSRSGVAITGRKVFNPNVRVVVQIENDDEKIEIHGVVRWRSGSMATSMAQGEMGVMFLEKNERYNALLHSLIQEIGEHREEPRIDKVLKVMFDTPAPLIEQYAHNISKGGLFVVSDEPLDKDSTIVLKMYVLDIMEVVTVECRVVRTVYREEARQRGVKSGMGLQFIKFHGDSERYFYDYIERLKVSRKLV
ncbi:MAG: PilZ domain-containing protein [Candidatus Alcyoniella australis]|nr:PilZ domain-containing protein [Candidatus Alcyoniella australis]